MTARPIRRNAQTPDRNGKIFYTSTTSLSHISKKPGCQAARRGRRCGADRRDPDPPAGRSAVHHLMFLQTRRGLSLCMKLSCYLRRMCVFPLKSFHIEDIKCLMPWLLAPGLSFPYPSRRFTTPHTPRPAPIATTRVFKVVIALLKNAIYIHQN